jgi:epoxyqueuosine reductase
MNQGQKLARAIKERARGLGFQLVGISHPSPLPGFERYQRWLAAGHHGGMQYLAKERALTARQDPRKLMPNCRAILSLAANHTPVPRPHDQPGQGRIAAYALGEDYHDVLVQRLKALMRWLEKRLGRPVEHRIYTDTGPLLERELAQRAGLGWIGKNACLINPQWGSYLFLAEVLLDLALPADEPFLWDRCGSCRRCIEACPTQCILPDRTVDARRCISYLTIEHRGAIDPSLRNLMDAWVFGCDICQQVCPWNVRFARPTQDPAFQPRPALQAPDLVWFLKLDRATYRGALRGSPLKRARFEGLLRNAIIAAANNGDPQLVPALISVLRCAGPPDLRALAAWALGGIPSRQARHALRQALASEGDPEVRQAVEQALQRSAT